MGRKWREREGSEEEGEGVKRKGREVKGKGREVKRKGGVLRGERRKEGRGPPDTPLLLYTVTVTRLNKNLAIANRSRVSCINTNNNTMTLKSGLEVTQGH